MLTTLVEAEIAELTQRFGIPIRWGREYDSTIQSSGWTRKLLKRQGEVVLVVPNGDGRVWLHTKSFYPPSIYRLPSGGIDKDESVESAALRETFEEMGFKPRLERFLGIVENTFKLSGESPIFPTFIFQTIPFAGPPRVTDPDEQISDFREAAVRELTNIVEQLDSLPAEWQPWGHFRAVPHALVLAALTKS